MNILTLKSNSASELADQIRLFSECKYRKIVDIIYSCIDYDDINKELDLNAEITASVVYQCKY